MKVYCINLKRRPDRLAHMSKQLNQMSVSFERVDAVDAHNQSTEASYESRCTRDHLGQRISLGAFACFESHRKTWKTMLNQGQRNAMIMEDDIIVSNDFRDYLKMSLIPEGADIVRLETFLTRTHVDRKKYSSLGSRKLHRLRSRHAGTGCYAITIKTAERLLAETEEISAPVDEFLFNESSEAFRKLLTLQMIPAPAIQGHLISNQLDEGWAQTSIQSRHVTDSVVSAESLLGRLLRRATEEIKALKSNTKYVVVPFS